MEIDLASGELPAWADGMRRARLRERAQRVAPGSEVGDDFLKRREGVLLLRAGWLAPWLEPDEKALLKQHVVAAMSGSSDCADGCPLCESDSLHAGVASADMSSVGIDALSRKLLEHLVNSAADEGYPQRDLRLASGGVAQSAQARLLDALEILASHVPLWEPLRADAAQRVVLFESDNLFGLTSPLVPETVFLNAACEVPEMVERLAHEATHGQIYNLQDALRVTEAPPDYRIVSPLRDDPRPVSGVVHATVVCARVAYVLRAVGAALGGDVGSRTAELAVQAASSALEGCEELLDRGRLTEGGTVLIRSAQELVSLERA